MRKDGKLNYRKCDISYSICGDSRKYSATAYIYIYLSDSILSQQITQNKTHPSINLAENSIIEACKEWLDNEIDIKKRFIPIENNKWNS